MVKRNLILISVPPIFRPLPDLKRFWTKSSWPFDQNSYISQQLSCEMKKVFFLVCIVSNTALAFCVAMSTTNTSVGQIGIFNSEIKMLIPEGWGFFTKNPQEDITEIYKIEGNSLNTVIFRSSDYHNFFGLDRRYRRLEAEKEIILNQVLPNKWRFNKPQLPLSNTTDTMIIAVQSKSIRNLHGLYLVCKSKRVPWAWTNLHSNFYGLIQYAVVDVSPLATK